MSYPSVASHTVRQFITLLLIYTLASPQVIIAAQRPLYERQTVSAAPQGIQPLFGERRNAARVPVTTALAPAFANTTLVGWTTFLNFS